MASWRQARKAQVYDSNAISGERHRHRYEVNIGYREEFEAAGLKMTGVSPDGLLPEIVERTDHPWFVTSIRAQKPPLRAPSPVRQFGLPRWSRLV